MPVTLQEILLAPETQPQVIDDCHTLIQQQVSDGAGSCPARPRSRSPTRR